MRVVLLTMVAIMVLLTIITIVLSLYTKKIENKFKRIQFENVLINDVCKEMIKHSNLPQIQIINLENGPNAYQPFKNIITLKKALTNSLADLVVATHEVGHYINFKEDGFFVKVIRKSTLLTIVNRMLLMPFFIIYFFYSKIFFSQSSLSLDLWVVGVLAAMFYVASFIRIVTCIPLENNASIKAISYIDGLNLIKEENVVDVKRFYLTAAWGQMSLVLNCFFLITIIIIVSI